MRAGGTAPEADWDKFSADGVPSDISLVCLKLGDIGSSSSQEQLLQTCEPWATSPIRIGPPQQRQTVFPIKLAKCRTKADNVQAESTDNFSSLSWADFCDVLELTSANVLNEPRD